MALPGLHDLLSIATQLRWRMGVHSGVRGFAAVSALFCFASPLAAILPVFSPPETGDGVISPFQRYADGVIFGFILGLALYNLALYVYIKERTYLLFGLFGLFSAVYICNISGYTQELLWPEALRWNSLFSWLTLALTLFLYTRVAMRFLDSSEHAPLAHSVLKVLGYAFLFIPVVGFWEDEAGLFRSLGYLLNATLSIIMLTTAMATALCYWPRQRSLAVNFLLSNGLFCIGGIIYASSIFGVISQQAWTAYVVMLGIIAQQMLFSVGIAQRVVYLRKAMEEKEREKERFQHQLIEQKNRELEEKVEQRTAELRREKEEVERLLHNILPIEIAHELRNHGAVASRRHEDISLMFTDFKGFTNTVSTIPAQRLVDELNTMFQEFDEIIDRHGLEKIKTIGDAYMIAGGLPRAKPNHAIACARAAWEMMAYLKVRNESCAIKWEMRIGIHSGSVVAGVVGKRKFTYDVWGDTVNIASRMEQASESMRINVSAYTYDLIRSEFDCSYRTKISAKGKGEIDMYFIEGPLEGSPLKV